MNEDRFSRTKEFLRVYALMIQAAQERQLIGYTDVAEIMGLPTQGHNMGQQTGQMLGEITRREHECGRAMLSAVVVRTQQRRPGEGFFELARQLGRLQETSSPDEQMNFWERERNAVFDEWSS